MCRFIKKILGLDVKDKIIKISGRASCCICSKDLYDNVYQVPGSRYYFCRKHAIQRAREITQNAKVTTKPKKIACEICGRPSNKLLCPGCFESNRDTVRPETRTDSAERKKAPPICEYSGCNKKLAIVSRFHCKYCQNWFCEVHRLPEKHKCEGNPKNPHRNSGRIIYSKGKTTHLTK
jgi:hypothetical protein